MRTWKEIPKVLVIKLKVLWFYSTSFISKGKEWRSSPWVTFNETHDLERYQVAVPLVQTTPECTSVPEANSDLDGKQNALICNHNPSDRCWHVTT